MRSTCQCTFYRVVKIGKSLLGAGIEKPVKSERSDGQKSGGAPGVWYAPRGKAKHEK